MSMFLHSCKQVSTCRRQTTEDGKCYGEIQEEAGRKCRPTVEKVKGRFVFSSHYAYIHVDAYTTVMQAYEDENGSLVDKNAALEEEFKKVSSFKPLLESYKHQINEMRLATPHVARKSTL